MSKKVNIVGMLLLAVCLFSLLMARTTEGAPTPDQIIARLQARLDDVLAQATNRRNELSHQVTILVNRFNSGNISRAAFCSALHTRENSSDRARTIFNRRIAKVARNARRQLVRVGADISYINDATNREDAARTAKHALYDVLDTEIDNAKQVPSPSC